MVPPAIPVTMPLVAPTVAIDVLLLLHVPPGVALLSNAEFPWHTEATPVIGDGTVTVNVLVATHPAGVV